MKFVVGLGNPGRRYSGTPHNVGFAVVDRLARDEAAAGGGFRRRFKAEVCEMRLDGERVYLVKPLTYMNLSGPAVRSILGYFKGGLEDLLVVHDDIDLPLGRLRFRGRGSAGGHRGVASVIEALGGGDFARLKIGVGRGRGGSGEESGGPGGPEIAGRPASDPADHVLTRFPAALRPEVDALLDRAAEAVGVWIRDGLERAAQLYNPAERA